MLNEARRAHEVPIARGSFLPVAAALGCLLSVVALPRLIQHRLG
jgi:hypothetical protein